MRNRFLPLPPARVVHEQPAHRLRRHREEVATVAVARPVLADQLQVRVVDQHRRLDRVARRLAPHQRLGAPAQLVVD